MTSPFAFMIDDLVIMSPDSYVWTPRVLGTTHGNVQIRSPYYDLQFRKAIHKHTRLGWLPLDNTVLSSLTVPSHDDQRQLSRYTEVVCVSVDVTYRHNTPTGIVASFVVNTEAR